MKAVVHIFIIFESTIKYRERNCKVERVRAINVDIDKNKDGGTLL